MMIYDLIIIGGGPAAVSAGIYAARKKLKTVLICQDWGGQANKAPLIDNYPGIEAISGMELMEKMVGHLKKQEIEIKQDKRVSKISKISGDGLLEVEANGEKYQTRALIVASGSHYKKLGLAEEDKFVGRGMAYCATCDAPLYKNKTVAVIGGGNAGLMTALALLPYAAKIHLLEFLPQLGGYEFYQDKVKASNKVEILTNVEIKKIKGDKFVSGLVYQERDSGELKELAVEGIFVAIGSTANSSFLKDVVELNQRGEVKIDAHNQTSASNIFAAGDVTDIPFKQVAVAVGEGAKAALSAYEYIKNSNA